MSLPEFERIERSAPPEARAKCGHGGRRPGSGRKPLGQFAPLSGELTYAKRLLSTLMRDESQPALLRARCALAIATKGTAKRSGPRGFDAKPPIDADADPGGDDRVAAGGAGGPTPL